MGCNTSSHSDEVPLKLDQACLALLGATPFALYEAMQEKECPEKLQLLKRVLGCLAGHALLDQRASWHPAISYTTVVVRRDATERLVIFVTDCTVECSYRMSAEAGGEACATKYLSVDAALESELAEQIEFLSAH